MGTRAVDRPAKPAEGRWSKLARWRAPAPSRPAGPDIDPRLRLRRIGVRRDEGRRRLHWLLAALAAVVLLLGAIAATRSPLLDVDHVTVTEVPSTSASDIRTAGAVRPGTSMIDLDPHAVARRVAALPWIHRAVVSRRWPGTVRIAVTERRVVAHLRSEGGGWLLIDGAGRVVHRQRSTPAPGVLLEGSAGARPGQFLARDWAPSLRVVASLPSVLKPRLVSVARRGADVQLRLAGGVVVDLASAVRLRAKFLALSTLLAEPDAQCFASINLDVASAPALTRRAGCA